eukprot:3331478-Alexandrium_andersonii.AAC.1
MRHLSSGPAPPVPADLASGLWEQVLGDLAPLVRTLVESLPPSSIDDCPAAVFADQSKAFERISWGWLRR